MTLTYRLAALILGFILDMILGDPYSFPHPVRFIGKMIEALEGAIRPRFSSSPQATRMGGTLLVLIVCLCALGGTALIKHLLLRLNFWFAFTFETLICYQLLATKQLKVEAMKVYTALQKGSLEEARYAVSMIVGRDTASLDERGIIRAAVETVAENASDGSIAPLLFLAIGGAPLGMFYKAVNTMDSMLGYMNEKYIDFGRTAAKLDDAVNFLPARIAGYLMCWAAQPSGLNRGEAFRVFYRDRLKHKSPNSAQTEAACAGALGVSLAGSNYYSGVLVDKPIIGDPLREIEREDIPRSCRLLYTTAVMALAICAALMLLGSLVL